MSLVTDTAMFFPRNACSTAKSKRPVNTRPRKHGHRKSRRIFRGSICLRYSVLKLLNFFAASCDVALEIPERLKLAIAQRKKMKTGETPLENLLACFGCSRYLGCLSEYWLVCCEAGNKRKSVSLRKSCIWCFFTWKSTTGVRPCSSAGTTWSLSFPSLDKDAASERAYMCCVLIAFRIRFFREQGSQSAVFVALEGSSLGTT